MKQVLLLVAILGIVCLGSRVSAQTSAFDPAVCSGNANGKITVRLISGIALQFEPGSFVPRTVLPPLQGPDLEPEGCPSNPLTVRGAYFPYQFAAVRETRADDSHASDQISPDLLTISGVEGAGLLQASDQALFEAARDLGGFCEEFTGGLKRCFKTIGGRGQVGYMSAKKTVQTQTSDLPMSGNCNSTVNGASFKCTLRYQLTSGLWISWRVNTARVNENEFTLLDQEIRQQVLKSRSPKFDINSRTAQ